MRWKNLIFLFLISVFQLSFAESGVAFLERVRANYDDLNSLSIEMKYDLYKGHKGNQLTESYTSFYGRSGKDSYRKIGSVEFINNDDYAIQVNHQDKMILVSDPSKNELFDPSLEDALRFCSSVNIESNSTGQLIHLIIKQKVDLPFSRLEIQVDKKLFVTSIVFYYSTQMNFSGNYQNPQMDFPRLEVTYENLSRKWKDTDQKLESSGYLKIQDRNILPADLLSGYNVLNLIKN